MYIACLFTSIGTGSKTSSPTEIVANTAKALNSYKEQLHALKEQLLATGNGEKIRKIGEVWAPRLNSGLFQVPWKHTRAVVERSGIDMHIRFPAGETEKGPRGTIEDILEAARMTEAAKPSLVTESSPLRARAKRTHESTPSEDERRVETAIDASRPKRLKIGKPPGKQKSTRGVAFPVKASSRYRDGKRSRFGKSQSPFEDETTSSDDVWESERDTDSNAIEVSRSRRYKTRQTPGKQTSTRDLTRPVDISSRPGDDKRPRSGHSESSFEDETASGDGERKSERDTESVIIDVRRSEHLKIRKTSAQQSSNPEVARPVTRAPSPHQYGEKTGSDKSESSFEGITTSDDEEQESEHDTNSGVGNLSRSKHSKIWKLSGQRKTRGVACPVETKSSRHRNGGKRQFGRSESPFGEAEE